MSLENAPIKIKVEKPGMENESEPADNVEKTQLSKSMGDILRRLPPEEYNLLLSIYSEDLNTVSDVDLEKYNSCVGNVIKFLNTEKRNKNSLINNREIAAVTGNRFLMSSAEVVVELEKYIRNLEVVKDNIEYVLESKEKQKTNEVKTGAEEQQTRDTSEVLETNYKAIDFLVTSDRDLITDTENFVSSPGADNFSVQDCLVRKESLKRVIETLFDNIGSKDNAEDYMRLSVDAVGVVNNLKELTGQNSIDISNISNVFEGLDFSAISSDPKKMSVYDSLVLKLSDDNLRRNFSLWVSLADMFGKFNILDEGIDKKLQIAEVRESLSESVLPEESISTISSVPNIVGTISEPQVESKGNISEVVDEEVPVNKLEIGKNKKRNFWSNPFGWVQDVLARKKPVNEEKDLSAFDLSNLVPQIETGNDLSSRRLNAVGIINDVIGSEGVEEKPTRTLPINRIKVPKFVRRENRSRKSKDIFKDGGVINKASVR